MNQVSKIFRYSGVLMGLLRIARAFFKRTYISLYRMLFSRSFGSFGKNSQIYKGNLIEFPKRVFLGNEVIVGCDNYLYCEDVAGSLVIKDAVTVGNKCHIDFTGTLEIGESTLLSEGVTIYTHDHGTDPKSTPVLNKLIIGSNVWVGAHALILPNVSKIGDNSIIAAGAVVTKEVPPSVIVGGNPATIIRNL